MTFPNFVKRVRGFYVVQEVSIASVKRDGLGCFPVVGDERICDVDPSVYYSNFDRTFGASGRVEDTFLVEYHLCPPFYSSAQLSDLEQMRSLQSDPYFF